MPNTEKSRLNKYLSESGVCSRRDADKLVEEGKVLVNGKPAVPGMRVGDQDRVVVNGREIAGREKKVVLAYYKPVGVTCTEKDRHAQVTIRDVLDYPVRVTYAGRLDRDSEGLLLMTNDGDLINGLMRAANYHEKEYLVRVNKAVSREFLKKMSDGVPLKDLNVTTRPCVVKEEGKFLFRITLTQGLNRQIRRMCRACGYDVVSIKRVRVANILLGKLNPGDVRALTNAEKQELYAEVERGGRRPAASLAKRENAKPRTPAADISVHGQKADGSAADQIRPGSASQRSGVRGQSADRSGTGQARPGSASQRSGARRQSADRSGSYGSASAGESRRFGRTAEKHSRSGERDLSRRYGSHERTGKNAGADRSSERGV